MSKKIIIDEAYRIETSTTGCSLILDTKGEMNPDTGKPKQIFDQWFYPNVKACLKKYAELQLHESHSVLDLIDKIDEMMEKIDSLEIDWKKVFK